MKKFPMWVTHEGKRKLVHSEEELVNLTGNQLLIRKDGGELAVFSRKRGRPRKDEIINTIVE